MASNSGWTTGHPSGTSKISDVDNALRSFKSHMEAWWEQEHYATDGSTNSAGIAKHGAGRAFVGTASQLSNPTADNDGRFFHVTDTAELRVGNVSTSSWSLVADNIQLTSANSWSALNDFSAGIETSDISVNNLFSGLTSYITYVDLGTIAASNGTIVTATDGSAANVTTDDFVSAAMVRLGASDDILNIYATAGAANIRFYIQNVSGSNFAASNTTLGALIFRNFGWF